jgi:putative glutamine amidotransferase
MQPVIGITTRPRTVQSSAGESEAHTLQFTYYNSVRRAGGIPILLAPVPAEAVESLLERVDGLVLTGGGDIEAHRYGGTPNDTMYDMHYDRDEFEIELARRTAGRRIPTLAICRGLQLLNVAFGGTLIEDIPSEVGSMDHSEIGHLVYNGHQHVRLTPGCRVADAVGITDLLVNSIHHQAVRDLAPGFTAVGWADDGIIEAIEYDDPDWPLFAVQWHPEYLGDADDAASWALFDALIAAAAARSLV